MFSTLVTALGVVGVAAAGILPRDTCTQYYTAVSGDTCNSVAQKFGNRFTAQDFIKWNPSVGADCRTMYAGTPYCVAVAPTQCSSNIPQPTQPGSTCQCKRWYYINSGDTCIAIEQREGVSAADLYRLNPGVHQNCDNLTAGDYLCVA